MTDHFVNKAPFNPQAAVTLTAAQEKYYLASQWQLIWWKLKKHKLAYISLIFLVITYLSLLISEFLNPYNPNQRHIDHLDMPPPAGAYYPRRPAYAALCLRSGFRV